MSTVIQDIIIPEKSSECSEWISYFKKLEEKFGSENAKTIWLKTWQVNGSVASCTTRPDFNTFFKKHDIDVTNLATAAVASAADLGGSLMGLGKGITKVLTYGVPAILSVIIGVVLYSIVRVAKNTSPSDLAQLTPEGRAASLLK
ncbi:MAG: hypothetical protein JST26_05520 [Bacteroidetes bacterium]|nr:hypothetical protein [Bacteroidota bacterium]